ncbi:hypothetical protein NECAME_09452 [Necator americanus]|uniref:Uncharacterized protein n=1 Tax=Necator americanus TaxID=51031 RepID=W2TDC2_NECAM|nr:hypothetical protein NECAME_09452 [Necator americanus]ETN80050.1 hypothetical protein NECAME_09452 [Necator americanus]
MTLDGHSRRNHIATLTQLVLTSLAVRSRTSGEKRKAVVDETTTRSFTSRESELQQNGGKRDGRAAIGVGIRAAKRRQALQRKPTVDAQYLAISQNVY